MRSATGVQPLGSVDFQSWRNVIVALAGQVVWLRLSPAGSRVRDTWSPLLLVASSQGDAGWLGWAAEQIKKAETNLAEGQQVETDGILLSLLAGLALEETSPGKWEVKPEVLLKHIADSCRHQRLPVNSWAIGAFLRDLGFPVRKVGGRERIAVTAALLKAAHQKLGVRDEAIDTF